jgi:hypothetical protein
MPMEKIAIYCKATDYYPMKEQASHFARYLEDKNLNCEVYFEKNSESNKEREKLLRKALNKNYNNVMVYSIQSWTSSINDLIISTKALVDNEVVFSSFKEGLYIDKSSFSNDFEILKAFADFVQLKNPLKHDTLNQLIGLSPSQPRCDVRKFYNDRAVEPLVNLDFV